MILDGIDPIDLEVFRSRLEAIGAEAAAAVEHTAISPVVTESKDFSCTLLDADGRLILGTGHIEFHFGAAAHAVRSTIARHGNSIAPGDVFAANDPHAGGGLHPQDIMVQQPIHVDGRRVGWVVFSAHLMDVGGMVVGSFAPAASDCYQEALRLPPVRLFRRGEEVTDVFDVFRNNVRMAQLVEMDLRSLVAGCHVAHERVAGLAQALAAPRFERYLRAIRELSARQMRQRIAAIEDGIYRTVSWTEFEREFHEIPCALTIDGDRMQFDFTGASPQTRHFFNSKPYIIRSEFVAMLAARIARDLPLNDGIFEPIEFICPAGSIVNATPPAPIAAAHMHVGLNAADVAMQAVRLALGASAAAPWRRWLTGAGFESALGLQAWNWVGSDGQPDAFLGMDGNWAGGSAGAGRDGLDLGRNLVGHRIEGSYTDIEILESWFPLLFHEKRARIGVQGAGRFRAGGGTQMSFEPHGVAAIAGTMLGMRRWLPLEGRAGGAPGACTEFLVHRTDGACEQVEVAATGVEVRAGERFEMRLGSGGGYGDPIDRDPQRVCEDVARGVFDPADALRDYGVVLDAAGAVDAPATAARREAILAQRLARARPAVRPLRGAAPLVAAAGDAVPLYPGVVQSGAVAYSEATGTALAQAPDHWTDGCPMLVERRWPAGPEVVLRSYLDPGSGRILHTEVVLGEAYPRGFEVSPRRWTAAGAA
ncbi:MAG: hydantoinase B/oxoprolinase family protein [Gammaproteobacteria bacterium]